MGSYLVYEPATAKALFVQQSHKPPTLPPGYGFIDVEPGAVIGKAIR